MSGGFFIVCGKMMVFCMTVYTVSLNSGGLIGLVCTQGFSTLPQTSLYSLSLRCNVRLENKKSAYLKRDTP
jgi:hypothetical protein